MSLQDLAAHEGYRSTMEHLADHLSRLDCLIQSKLQDKPHVTASHPFDFLKGLVISPEEVADLLSDPTATHSAGDDIAASLRMRHDAIAWREAATPEEVFLGLRRVEEIFRLTPLEKDCLLICLAPEMDAKYEKLYAYLLDDVTKKNPTPGLLTQLFCTSVEETVPYHAALHPSAPLLRYRLLTVASPAGTPFPSQVLKLDDQIKDFLIGLRFVDRRVAEVATLAFPAAEEVDAGCAPFQEVRRAAVTHFSGQAEGKNLILFLHGSAGSGRKTLAKAVCHDLQVPLLVADLAKAPEDLPLEDTVWLLAREAVLHSCALCFDGADRLAALKPSRLEALLESVRTFSRLTFFLTEEFSVPRGALAEDAVLDCTFPFPDEAVRREIWGKYLAGEVADGVPVDVEGLAGKFRFTPGQIRQAALAARNRAHCLAGTSFSDNLHDVCRRVSAPGRPGCEHRTAQRSWEDIVLPALQMAQMREVCDQAKFRKVVFGDWGFGRKLSIGKGLAVLFAGPPGSGKTLAAEIIACELQLHLYKVDISRIVDKYIGETEKNLDRVFSEAERGNAVLFFDEADALFGKRSETKDAHDRYANIEVGYLLQRIEEYEGIVILATNLAANMDEAFQRRMNFIIPFPFPEPQDRERIWRTIFPSATPLRKKVDFPFLAEKLKVCGGNIKNIAVASAFLAAGKGGAIGMEEILKATKREYHKLGKPLVPGDFAPYSHFLGDD